MRSFFALLHAFTFFSLISALASTDTITWGGDASRSGYQPNHNMDPAVVGSSQFGQIFKTALPGNYGGQKEQVFAAPLVYTTGDGNQYVYLATQQNNVYKLNAKTGVIVASRNLHIPFLTSDLDGCVDINPHVGSTATGVIDPATNTWYLTTKTYVDQNPGGAKGRPNGRYYFHAISVDDLSERANFPVDLEGTVARNNPNRSFNGGIHHQRPALLHQGQYIYFGFASHCVQYNFTGWIMGFDKSTGQNVERYATEGAGVKNTVPGGGVWMSGGGLASDGRGSMWFATGNGYASQLNGIPVAGRSPPTSLEEAAVHMTINGDGSLTPVDFFMPWEKTQLDGADKDLGTSPLQILPSEFSCGDIARVGVVTGKSGKTYWINLDNMGGYQNGPNKLDAVIQTYQNENSVYAGAGVYPLEGGYIYINVIQYPSHVFKFSCDGGRPSFTKVADSPTKNAYILGVGHGTTTSLNGAPGTGLVWTADVEGANLRIYNAVPQNGLLTMINSFNIPGQTKFGRPVFGDGRVYMTTLQGLFYGFGSPVNSPLNCSSPYDFGVAALNSTSAFANITCQALVNTQVTGASIAGNKNFILGQNAFPVTVPKGGSFTFQAAFTPTQVGTLSSDALLNTTTTDAGFSSSMPVKLIGQGQSANAILAVTPNTVSFDGVITGQQAGGVDQSIILLNLGNTALNISAVQCSSTQETGPFTTASVDNGVAVCGAFTFTNVPSFILGNSQNTVTVTFNPLASGNYVTFLRVVTNGGSKTITFAGVSGEYPNALLEFQTPDGLGWVQYSNSTPFSFGDVLENTNRYLKMRLTNVGGNSSARLSVTVSKPPFGVAGIIGAANQVDLAEGTTLGPGESATASLYCAVPKSPINVDSYAGAAHWTMNLGDPAFGKQSINFACNAVSEQAAPLFANGTARYRYRGCYQDLTPNRVLPQQIYVRKDSTNGNCVAACSAAGYAVAGTEYQQECWCGASLPPIKVDDANCNYACTGSVNQFCGGNGVKFDGSYMSVFSDPTAVKATPAGPVVNNGTNGYVSLGCYNEITGRALSVNKNLGQANSIANCTAACKGYTYAGVEYGVECYCGNTLAVGSNPAPIDNCNMPCAGNASEFCGAGNRLNIYSLNASPVVSSSASASASPSPSASASASASPSVSPSPVSASVSAAAASPTPTVPYAPLVVGNYSYVGCNTEINGGRALSGRGVASDDMTLEKCATACAGFTYFGLEYARECYCGNTIDVRSVNATDGNCRMTCVGNAMQLCGGPVRISLYQLTPAVVVPSASPSPSTVSSVSASIASSLASSSAPSSMAASASASSAIASSVSASSSALASSAVASSSAPASSADVSSSAPASSSVASSSAPASSAVASSSAPASSADASSAVASSASASASSATSSAQSSSAPASSADASSVASSSVASSAVSSMASSVASSAAASPSASAASSVASSAAASSSASSAAASSSASSSPASSAPASSAVVSSSVAASSASSSAAASSAPASSATSSVASSVASSAAPSSAASSAASSVASSASASSVVSSAAPSASALPDWTYVGCANETSGRALNLASTAANTMTIQQCQKFCLSKNLPLAGLEYGRECYCGTALQTGSAFNQQGCNMKCAGAPGDICGGSSRLSVYNYTAYVPPQLVPTVGTFKLQGCYSEPPNARALPAYSFTNTTSMTAELCVAGCQAKGYTFAGVEYGQECWCDKALSVNSVKLANTDCNMLCPGNQREYCGAGSKLAVYKSS